MGRRIQVCPDADGRTLIWEKKAPSHQQMADAIDGRPLQGHDPSARADMYSWSLRFPGTCCVEGSGVKSCRWKKLGVDLALLCNLSNIHTLVRLTPAGEYDCIFDKVEGWEAQLTNTKQMRPLVTNP